MMQTLLMVGIALLCLSSGIGWYYGGSPASAFAFVCFGFAYFGLAVVFAP